MTAPLPLVSILIPAYNAQPWIAATLRSAIGQTWPRVEIIVVDDGSTDQTVAVARALASPKLKIVSQANRGASVARNLALSLAQGDYVQWLDADDLLAPDKIEAQLTSASDGLADGAVFTASFGEFLARPEKAHFRPTVLWQDMTPIDFLLHKFNDNVWMNPAAWLISRELADRAGPWDERLSLDDDGEYFTRIVSRSSGIHFVPRSRVFYRRGNPGSLSRSVSDRACESLLLSLGLCIRHALEVEDSPRVRLAGVKLLQNWVDHSDCFCPDAPDRFDRACLLARELGGALRPHRISWKYAPIKALFGWTAARRARSSWSNLKLTARLRIDERAASHDR